MVGQQSAALQQEFNQANFVENKGGDLDKKYAKAIKQTKRAKILFKS